MKFYDCAPAPSPRRVRIFLAEKGLDVEVQEVDLRGGEQLSDEFKKINPDCTVPVLELDDGTRLTESIAICQYLEELNPEPALMGRDATERAQVLEWNAKAEQQGLTAIAEAFRNQANGFSGRALPGPHSLEQIPELAKRGLIRTGLFFDRLDRQLENRQYMVGDQYTLADITSFVALEFAGWLKLEAGGERPHLQRWLEKVKLRPSSSV